MLSLCLWLNCLGNHHYPILNFVVVVIVVVVVVAVVVIAVVVVGQLKLAAEPYCIAALRHQSSIHWCRLG